VHGERTLETVEVLEGATDDTGPRHEPASVQLRLRVRVEDQDHDFHVGFDETAHEGAADHARRTGDERRAHSSSSQTAHGALPVSHISLNIWNSR
jgi:hypothetical protein